jgi:hypothetical protein
MQDAHVVTRWMAVGCLLLAAGCGRHEGPGEVTGSRIPPRVIKTRAAAQARDGAWLAGRADVARPEKQILFGDLHVHSTFSADAFMMSLPIFQGEGAHPVADACDFARYCSALDFWSITDHAEGLTPRRWRETKETVRRCNALAGDPENPDLVTFLGWEWTQIGRTAKDHYGHKNVILRDTAEDAVPTRPIHSASFATRAMRQRPPFIVRWAPIFLDWPNRQRYADMLHYQDELRAVPDCPDDVNVHDLPAECLEGAPTPKVLFRKLHEWGFPALVIPHGTTWGIYTPAGSSWEKQLTREQHDPGMQKLVEIYSGHGNSEQYRPWRAADFDQNGNPLCPEPSDGYEPCCWRAGELIRARCDDPTSAQCEQRVQDARTNYLAAGTAGRFTVPGATVEDWGNCGSCPDCFLPSMDYRPASSVQYMLARTNLEDPADPLRFQFGFIGSSDNHRARPGTGYKEYARLANTEASGARDKTWYDRVMRPQPPAPESLTAEELHARLQPYQQLDFERNASFFMTGGLVAVHSAGRSRQAIWDALERREVYGTSGQRILLWFDLINGPDGDVPMGGRVEFDGSPRFRVRAAGSFKQAPGCPEAASRGLSPDRIELLCHGECYNPTDERIPITRIEVVRIRRQVSADESVASLIDDPWRSFDCPQGGDGCVVEFSDPEWASLDREVVYYVRAIQAPTPAINAGGLRCEYDADGKCVRVHPCYGDYRTDPKDDCLAPAEERAWSSPIYVAPET